MRLHWAHVDQNWMSGVEKTESYSTSQFALQFADGRVTIWQKQLEFWKPFCLRLTVKYKPLLLLGLFKYFITYFRTFGKSCCMQLLLNMTVLTRYPVLCLFQISMFIRITDRIKEASSHHCEIKWLLPHSPQMSSWHCCWKPAELNFHIILLS